MDFDTKNNQNMVSFNEKTEISQPFLKDENIIQGKQQKIEQKNKISKISFDSIMDDIGFGKFQIYLFFILGSFCLVDASQIFIAPMVIPILKKQEKMDSDDLMFFGTGLFFGQVFGSYISGVVADKYGRRKPMIFATFFTFVITLASAFSFTLYDLILYRILLGVCLGFAWPVGIPLLTEFCPTKNRGKYLNFWQVFYALGMIVDIIIAWFQFTNLEVGNWRLYIIILSIFALVSFILTFLFLSESARFLLLHNKNQEALQIINRVAKTNINRINNLNEEEENALIQWSNSIQKSTTKKPANQKETFSQKMKLVLQGRYKLITPILWFTWFSVYLSENGIAFLLPLTLVELQQKAIGTQTVQTSNQQFLSLIYAVIPVAISYILAGLIADVKNLGRKNSLITSGILIFIFSAILQFNVWPGFITWISLENFFINVSISLLYEYTSEIYPTKFRATAMGLSCCLGNIGAIVMPFIGIYLTKFSTFTPYLLFGALPAMSALLMCFIPYDTKGHGLDFISDESDTEEKLNNNSKIKNNQSAVSSHLNSALVHTKENTIEFEVKKNKQNQ